MRLADLEEPSEEAWLLMRIAQRISQFQQAFNKGGEPIRLESQQVQPSEKGPAPKLSDEEINRRAKAQHGIY